jgi:hypothetical protein
MELNPFYIPGLNPEIFRFFGTVQSWPEKVFFIKALCHVHWLRHKTGEIAEYIPKCRRDNLLRRVPLSNNIYQINTGALPINF